MTEQIPGPAGWPLIGNLLDVQGEVPIKAIEHVSDIYGPIIKLSLGGNDRLFVGGFDIFDELCDETRFYKLPPPALTQNAPAGARGLFTSSSEKDPDWGQAHRILMPAFGPLAIQNMFDEMHDIATQMVMKWARLGSESTVLLTEDFTRLTLDTIALCAMDYRFNSFYSDTVHPYVQAMTNTLAARSQFGQIGQRIKVLLKPSYVAQLKADAEYMGTVGRDLVQHRRDNPTDKKDLLNNMIHGKDPKTGESMRDELIAANMQTFLVAGHETTSGLLSFAFMYLLMNPSTFFAAQQEVDRVLGTGRIEPHTLNELPYLNAVLRETLRLSPTAPGFARGVRPENKDEKVTVAGGKYEIPRGAAVLCLLGKIQRDPKVWGEDADQFRPERMLDENFAKLPKNAWKPFGTGLRACIGRAFAWQEALLVTALLLQNFTISLADPNYKMQIQQTLTIKPKNTYVHVKLRPGINATQLLQRLTGTSATAPEPSNGLSSKTTNGVNGVNGVKGADGPTLAILYGSNTGTCQSLAQSLAVEAGQHGYTATVHDLDTAVEHVPKGPNTTVVIITASYEGQPPDNAARFIAWLERVEAMDAFAGTRFAVFGCGHVDWASTYQRIPTLVGSLLEEHGATRVAERGVSDASQRDMFGDFAKWTENVLWKALPSADDAAAAAATDGAGKKVQVPTMDMDISTEQRATHLQQKLFWAKVTAARQLTAPGQPEKRHIEFQLPSDMTYHTGDYLAVLPLNPDGDVRRVIQRFRLPWDSVVTIKKGGPTTLPTDTPIALAELLRGYVELALPATRKDIEVLRELADHSDNSKDGADSAKRLSTLRDNPAAFTTTIIEHRTSLLDLLEQNPGVELPLASFLIMLPPLRARHYSIASSPLASPDSCALCYSVIDEPAWQGTDEGNANGANGTKTSPSLRKFRGVTGTYLKSLQVGDQALVAVRATNQFFRPPADPESTPLLMFCAGSGFAPFRGFLQERAVQIRDGNRKLAPATLFVGCRSSDADRLYADEVDEWVRDGVVDVRYAFSKDPENHKAAGCRYVPERLLHDKDDVVAQWKAGAKVYTCGSGQVAKDLGAAARKLILERARAQAGEGGVVAATEEEAAAWMQQRHNERFVTDVFT